MDREAIEGGPVCLQRQKARGVTMVTWGSENRVGMPSKRYQKRIRNGGRVRKKLQRGGAMNQINVQMSARSLGFYLCCMVKTFFFFLK